MSMESTRQYPKPSSRRHQVQSHRLEHFLQSVSASQILGAAQNPFYCQQISRDVYIR